MKRKSLVAFCLCILFSIINAKAAVSISSFMIPGQYLTSGQLRPNPGAATLFTANFLLTKVGNTYNTVKVSLVLEENGSSTILSTTSITHSDSEWGNSVTWEGTISGSLPANKLNGNIYLQYTVTR
ncbi:hypothetical protein [Pedobacter hartonius]|uniref:Uncharacterized protein n=1 Tax=Pedobacter hartonius TaxID=425514 RepID=A0A1H3WDW3_9SPHI|nr:hypothetical protein [Pedobacter hartonius]SDZ84594.1 hypothetical protein SAMN05443550_101186 [Pedobacter hartonius]